mmetsp:Transcript_53419/g.114254  ORF Transcript_53419/g.114254 Transcript_53419/m.114254 type:complete len:209 (+) Transcript_53419:115-741(+)
MPHLSPGDGDKEHQQRHVTVVQLYTDGTSSPRSRESPKTDAPAQATIITSADSKRRAQSKFASFHARFTHWSNSQGHGGFVPGDASRRHGSLASTYARNTLFSAIAKPDVQVTLGELVTFEGCQDLLRASSLTRIMQHQGALFRGSKGSNLTYKLSRPALVCFATSMGWLPLYEDPGSTYIEKTKVGIVCQLTLIPVFFVVAFFAQVA